MTLSLQEMEKNSILMLHTNHLTISTLTLLIQHYFFKKITERRYTKAVLITAILSSAYSPPNKIHWNDNVSIVKKNLNIITMSFMPGVLKFLIPAYYFLCLVAKLELTLLIAL